jgi:hypothetical protein
MNFLQCLNLFINKLLGQRYLMYLYFNILYINLQKLFKSCYIFFFVWISFFIIWYEFYYGFSVLYDYIYNINFFGFFNSFDYSCSWHGDKVSNFFLIEDQNFDNDKNTKEFEQRRDEWLLYFEICIVYYIVSSILKILRNN